MTHTLIHTTPEQQCPWGRPKSKKTQHLSELTIRTIVEHDAIFVKEQVRCACHGQTLCASEAISSASHALEMLNEAQSLLYVILTQVHESENRHLKDCIAAVQHAPLAWYTSMLARQ